MYNSKAFGVVAMGLLVACSVFAGGGGGGQETTLLNCETINDLPVRIRYTDLGPVVQIDSKTFATVIWKGDDDYTRDHGGLYLRFTGGLEFRGAVNPTNHTISSGVLSGPEIFVHCLAPKY